MVSAEAGQAGLEESIKNNMVKSFGICFMVFDKNWKIIHALFRFGDSLKNLAGLTS